MSINDSKLLIMAKKSYSFTIPQSDFVNTLNNRNKVLVEYAQQENILLKVFNMFNGFNLADVLTRITLLNQFYSTAILDIGSMANNIVNVPNVQSRLLNGVTCVVSDIAKVQHHTKVWTHMSFASKFASFHNPAAYPILDRMVMDVFCELKRRGFFVKNTKFSRESLRSNYKLYKDVYDEFMQLSGIKAIQYNGRTPNYKDVDNYLWASRKIKSLDPVDPRITNAPTEYNQIVNNFLNSQL